MTNIQIDYMPDDPAVIQRVAEWHQKEWSHLNPWSLEERIRFMQGQGAQKTIPLTVLAWEDGQPVASASLLTHDMDIHPEWFPWLASVYVQSEMRGRGLGSLVVERIEQEARRLGLARFFLYTPDRASFYKRMGWNTLEEINYKGVDVTIMDRVLEIA